MNGYAITMNVSPTPQTRPDDRKDRILDVAQSFIQTVGYNGFSYRDVAEIIGIKSASIHHHFPKKEDLGVAVTLRYSDRFASQLSAIKINNTNLRTILKSYLSLFKLALSQEGHMCLCGMLGSETTSLPVKVRDQTQKFFALNVEWLCQQFEKPNRNGEALTPKQAQLKAQLFLSTLEGAMILAKSSNSQEQFNEIGMAAIANLTD
jgi:TetR/AcrR family transcriptional regulator, transcriptional repressor for nem operon